MSAAHKSAQLAGVLLILFAGSPAAADPFTAPIGVVTATEGNVYVARTREAKPRPLTVAEPLYAEDILETQPRSRAQLLLDDDTLIALAEDTRLVLSGSGASGRRALLEPVRLERGQARVLVSRATGLRPSTFHLRASHLEVAIDHAYVALWLQASAPPTMDSTGPVEQPAAAAVGVANIGTIGQVEVSSAGETILLPPGSFSVAAERMRPQPPVASADGDAVQRVLAATEVKPIPKPDTARALVAALEQDRPLLAASDAAREAVAMATAKLPSGLYTPPAVISGAIPGGSPATGTFPSPATTSTAPSSPPAASPPVFAPTPGAQPSPPAPAPPPATVIPPAAPPPAPPAAQPPPFPKFDLDDIVAKLNGKHGKKGRD
ncbi:FecR domain-containing protein [Candidatus Nitrospira bockiana]